MKIKHRTLTRRIRISSKLPHTCPDQHYAWLPSRSQLKHILTLALPIVGGMLSQAIMNIIDAALVGLLSPEALAGVGVGGYATFMVSSLVMGLGSGVQAVAGRRFGEGEPHRCAEGLHAGLLIATILSCVLIPVCWLFSQTFMSYMSNDPAVLSAATTYFQIRLISVLAVGLNFSFRGFLNAINLSQIYMRTLLCMHPLNALISYVLIFGKWGFPELGVAGAAWGTTLSMCLGSLLYAFFSWQSTTQYGFLKAFPTRIALLSVIRLALPNSLQSLFFSAGLTVLFWIYGQIGSAEVAVGHALVTLLLFVILPAMGIGMAAATFVSQSLGKNAPEEAYWWAWRTTVAGVIILALPGLFLLAFPDRVLSLFFHDSDLIALGRAPLKIIGCLVSVEAVVMILPQALLGAGDSKTVMGVTVLSQWCFFLPLAWFIGVFSGKGFLVIWVIYAIYRVLNAFIFTYYWVRKTWQHIQIL